VTQASNNRKEVIAYYKQYQIRYIFSKWTQTPEYEEWTNFYNENEYCGYNNWRTGSFTDVTNCVDFPGPQEKYDIVLIDSGKLYLGDIDSGNGLAENTRSTQLDSKY